MKLGMTQAEMAEVLGCTQGNIAFLERGQILNPTQAKALKVHAGSKGFDLTLDQIYAIEALPNWCNA